MQKDKTYLFWSKTRFINLLKHKFLALICLVCALYNTNAYGQSNERDSLILLLNRNEKGDSIRVNRLIQLSFIYDGINIDSARQLAIEAKTISEEIGYTKGLGSAYSCIGNVHYFKREFDEAISAYSTAIEIRSNINDLNGEAGARQNLAGVYSSLGQIDYATEELLKVRDIFIMLKDTADLAGVLNDIGYNQSNQNQHSAAYQNFQAAYQLIKGTNNKSEGIILTNLATLFLKTKNYNYATYCADEGLLLFDKAEFIRGKGVIEGILGNIYIIQEKFEEAEHHYKQALEYAEFTGDKIGMSRRLNNLGVLYYKIGDDEKSLNCLRQTVAITKNSYANLDYAFGLGNMGGLYLDLGDIDSAIYSGLTSLEMQRLLGDTIGNLGTNQMLSKSYEAKGDYVKALHYKKTAEIAKDSLMSIEKMKIIKEMEVEYETRRIEKENELLSIKNNLVKTDLEKSKLLIWYSSIGLILIIILILFYFQFRKNNLKRKAVEFEQMALRAQMNPHFIFNSLNSIQRLYIEQKMDEASDYMADFSQLLRTILDNSSKHSITLKEELKHLDLYCEIEQLRTGGMLAIKYEIDSDIDINSIKISPMIIQPFVENSIWHGIVPTKKKGTITIKIKSLKNDQIEITIEDNGVGWKNTKQTTHNSKGIELIEKRIGSKIAVKNLLPGTSVTFKTKKL